MTWKAADLDALKEAYATGTLRVRMPDGRDITYPSGDDLLRRIRMVESELAAGTSGRVAPVARFATYRRG